MKPISLKGPCKFCNGKGQHCNDTRYTHPKDGPSGDVYCWDCSHCNGSGFINYNLYTSNSKCSECNGSGSVKRTHTDYRKGFFYSSRTYESEIVEKYICNPCLGGGYSLYEKNVTSTRCTVCDGIKYKTVKKENFFGHSYTENIACKTCNATGEIKTSSFEKFTTPDTGYLYKSYSK